MTPCVPKRLLNWLTGGTTRSAPSQHQWLSWVVRHSWDAPSNAGSAAAVPPGPIRQRRDSAVSGGGGGYLTPAMLTDPDGYIPSSTYVLLRAVGQSRRCARPSPGDRWRMSGPHVRPTWTETRRRADGGGHRLRHRASLIMDDAVRTKPAGPPVLRRALSVRAHDLRTLREIASCNPWLSVSPVSSSPPIRRGAADYRTRSRRGGHLRQTGRLPEVVTGCGGWGDRQILSCGRPRWCARNGVRAGRSGAEADRIQHDPLVS